MSKVLLSAKAATDDKKLTVSYSVVNETGKKLYVFAVLWTVKEGKIVAEPHPAYASIDDKRALHLGKIVHPLPKQRFVEGRYVPFAKAVAVKGKWEEKLEFALPVQEFNPYYIAEENSLWDEVALGTARLCVDYVVEVDGLKAHEAPIEGSFRLEHPQLLKLVERATSADMPLKAAGLRRTDTFERFTCEPERK
jgi:hypothetical protein